MQLGNTPPPLHHQAFRHTFGCVIWYCCYLQPQLLSSHHRCCLELSDLSAQGTLWSLHRISRWVLAPTALTMLPGLFFLPAIKRQKIEPGNSRTVLFAEIHVYCILEGVPIHQHTAVLTAQSERRSAPKCFCKHLMFAVLFWELWRWTPTLADNVQAFLGFTHNFF